VHGAPSTAAESREVLARLKRMAGFESQDFDPAVWMEPVAFTSYACMLACCHIVPLTCMHMNHAMPALASEGRAMRLLVMPTQW
jgi:hypothetical protein